MGTRAVNPLERSDKALLELWVANKKEKLERADSKFNQEDYDLDDGEPDNSNLGDQGLDYGEYFEQWEYRFNEL